MKQFWIKEYEDGNHALYSTKPKFKYDYHVVEYSTYEQLKFDMEATEKVYQMNRQYVEDAKQKITELEEHISELKHTVNFLNDAIEDLKYCSGEDR